MDGRWRRGLREATSWVTVAGTVLLGIAAFGGAGAWYLLDPPADVVLFVGRTVALLGSLATFLCGFWRGYHRGSPGP